MHTTTWTCTRLTHALVLMQERGDRYVVFPGSPGIARRRPPRVWVADCLVTGQIWSAQLPHGA
eukprot:4187562-Amphidinium_carterae.1